MRVFLGAHGAGFAGLGVEQHGSLLNGAAFFNLGNLPLNLEVDGLLHEAEGVQVLDFTPGAELLLSNRTDRNVGVAAERSFLHVSIADADPAHQRVQRLGVGDGFGRRAHVGFRDDFEQRRSGTVEIDPRLALEVLVQRLAGVFFQVGTRQIDRFLRLVFALAKLDAELAANDYRQLELADLITLGKVGIKVILARENRLGRNFTLDGEAEADGAFHRAFVEHRQDAGEGDIDRVGLDVRFSAERRRAAGEDFRLGQELSVRLDADYHFPLFHRVLLSMRNLTCES